MFSQKNKLLFLLIGSGMGAGIALMFAPAPGAELRSGLMELARSKFDGCRKNAKQIVSAAADASSLSDRNEDKDLRKTELDSDNLLELT